MEGNALSSTENFFQSNLLLLENTSKQRIQTVFPSANRILNTRKTIVFIELAVKENCWIMKRTLEFADSKATGKRWIFLSENVRKMLEKFRVFKYSELVFRAGEHHMFRNEARMK